VSRDVGEKISLSGTVCNPRGMEGGGVIASRLENSNYVRDGDEL
jgi:hypothetical protein